MASEEGWQDVEVRRFLGHDVGHFQEFFRNVEEIQKGIDAIKESTANTGVSRRQELVKFYTEQGGTSRTPSRAPNWAVQGGVLLDPQAGGTQEAVVRQAAQSHQQSSGAGASTPPGLQKMPNPWGGAKTLLGIGSPTGERGFKNWYSTYGNPAGIPPDYGGNTDEMDDTPAPPGPVGSGEGAGTGGSSGASRPSNPAETYLQHVGPLTVPRAGEFTVQNVVGEMAKIAAGRASDAYDATIAAEGGAQSDRYRSLMGVTGMLDTASTKWVPAASLAHQYGQRALAMGSGFTSYGEALGVPGGAPGQPGPMGANIGPVRLPTEATLTGLKANISDWWTGVSSPGLSQEQVSQNRMALAELGWDESSERTPEMLASMNRISQFSSSIGSNPLTAQGYDKSVRQGTTSIEEFEEILRRIPAAADAANVSLAQMQEDMNVIGEMNQEMGGSWAEGARLSQSLATTTGMPSQSVMGLTNSPYAQGRIMSQTGIAPWAQGTISGGARTALSLQGFQEARSIASGIGPTKFRIPGTDIVERSSAAEQQAAYMKGLGLYPDVAPETLEKMLANPKLVKGMQAGSALGSAVENWSMDVGTAQDRFEKRGGDPSQVSDALGGIADVRRLAATARNPVTGERFFTRDEVKDATAPLKDTLGWLDNDSNDPIRDEVIAKLRDSGNTALASKLSSGNAILGKANLDPDDYNEDEMEVLNALTAKNRASAAYNALQEKIAEKTESNDTAVTGDGTVIELSEAAKQFFNLQSPQTSAKLDAGAGSGTTPNYPYGSGPTFQPSPRVNR